MAGLAEDDIAEAPWKAWAKRGLLALALAAVAAGVVFVARQLTAQPGTQQKQMAKIRIVPDTPPPPPKQERPPDPPKEVKEAKEIKVDQPKPAQAPPTEQLKMEGDASADGLAGVIGGAVTQEYAGGPLGRGGGWYGGVIERELQRMLARDDRIRGVEFRVVLKLWLGPEGQLQRFEIAQSSGDAKTDAAIRQALAEMPPLRDRPPEGLPQPISLRITSRS
jgi:periplasmic protein TonB